MRRHGSKAQPAPLSRASERPLEKDFRPVLRRKRFLGRGNRARSARIFRRLRIDLALPTAKPHRAVTFSAACGTLAPGPSGGLAAIPAPRGIHQGVSVTCRSPCGGREPTESKDRARRTRRMQGKSGPPPAPARARRHRARVTPTAYGSPARLALHGRQSRGHRPPARDAELDAVKAKVIRARTPMHLRQKPRNARSRPANPTRPPRPGPHPGTDRPLPRARSRIRDCSFSKARTSIWRIRSRETP